MHSLSTLSGLVADKRVIPTLPPGRKAFAPEDEQPAGAKPRDGSSSWSAYISYVDAKGQPSERRFTCHRIEGFGAATHIRGWCHERGAIRTLLVGSIRELACAETGEVLDAGEHFSWLRETGALRVEDKALTELARIMVFLARCDGEYHPLEAEALADVYARYAVRFGGDDDMIERAINGSGRLAPDGTDLTDALQRFITAPNAGRLCRFVLDSGAAMIDADGEHHPEEMAWAIEVSSALKAACQK